MFALRLLFLYLPVLAIVSHATRHDVATMSCFEIVNSSLTLIQAQVISFFSSHCVTHGLNMWYPLAQVMKVCGRGKCCICWRAGFWKIDVNVRQSHLEVLKGFAVVSIEVLGCPEKGCGEKPWWALGRSYLVSRISMLFSLTS